MKVLRLKSQVQKQEVSHESVSQGQEDSLVNFFSHITPKGGFIMAPFTNLRRTVYLGLLASMFVGTPAFAEISLPSAIELEKSIYFQNPSGEPVQINPGMYDVAQNGENALNIIPLGGKAGEAMPIQALPAGHDEDVAANTAHLVPSPDNNADKQHLVFVTPDGLALESVGSYSGVFSRAAITYAEQVGGEAESSDEEPLTVEFEKAIYFKTPGGEPTAVQPGEYEIALADEAVLLTPTDGKSDAITIEPEALGTSAAVVLPGLDDNPNHELLMIGTVGGQSLVALGSHDGTFPRGLFGKLKSGLKKAAGKVKNVAKKKAGSAYRFAKGKAKKIGKKAIMAAKKHGRKALQKVKSHGLKYAKKYGKKIAASAWKHGKKVVSKVCGQGRSGKCIDVIAKHGGQLLQGAGS